jgi:hypothetical protein
MDAVSYIVSRFQNIISLIEAVRLNNYGTAYAQLWTVLKVKEMALAVGIRWVDDGKSHPMVRLGNGLQIKLNDIVAATAGMAWGTFSNARTRYGKALRVYGLVSKDNLPEAKWLSYDILGVFLQTEQANHLSSNIAERSAAAMPIAKLDTIINDMDAYVNI